MNGLDLSSSLLLLLIDNPKVKIIRIMHIVENPTPAHTPTPVRLLGSSPLISPPPPPLPPPPPPPASGPGAPASGLRRYGLSFSASSLLQAPLAALLEYSVVVPSGPAPQTPQPAVPSSSSEADGLLSAAAAGDGDVLIRIQGGPGDPDAAGVAAAASPEDSIEATAAPDVDPSSAAGRGGGADADASGGAVGFAEVMDLERPPPLAAADASPEVAACSICLDPVVGLAGERSTARLQCGHEFHLDCIGSAFNAKGAMQCPNCRKIENGRWLYANGHHPSSDFGIGDWVTSEANNLISDHDFQRKFHEEESMPAARRESVMILHSELKRQRKLVKNLKKKSLWPRTLEEIVEKLVDIVIFLHKQVWDAFSKAGTDLLGSEQVQNQRLGPCGLALHYANIINQIENIVSRPLSLPPSTKDNLYHGLPVTVKSALRSRLQSFI